MVIIFMFIRYDIFDGNIRFQSRSRQLSFYVAYRSGIMAVAHLPLIVAFAGRNNILGWLTGWSYDTFNLYHRWLARVMFTLGFIHSIGFTVFYHIGHKYRHEFQLGFFRWGAVAITSGGIILFFSLRHFREQIYDVFLVIHWIFVSIFFAGVWWHLDDLDNREWIYASVALWAFDRFMRLVRIVFSSIKSVADLQLHEPSQLIKLKVKYSNLWEPKPGAYVFIHFIEPIWSITHNHPFSCYPSPEIGEDDVLVLCIRVRNGKTKQLAKHLNQQLQAHQKMRIMIDGPYGHSFPLTNSHTIVLLAGGIGITAVYSYACRLLDQGQKKRIIMVWAVKDIEMLNVFDNEIKFLRQRNSIDITIYVTNGNILMKSSPETTQTYEKTKLDTPDSPVDYLMESPRPEYSSTDQQEITTINYSPCDMLTAKYGEQTIMICKPNIKDITETLIAESQESIAFLACGPPRFNDDVRKNVTDQMGNCKGRVDLFLESYNW
ncbi:uncharacterized protein SAPINGB_P000939 [Magnusiomyces paraingens]|uniref:ferric-chelate reductase (NADPH) n=1 Tax=Magnusiomyces paraingens TaxID=2606893 RepID=A0A5E8B359_9ASCO|nr:uncharacterized protein SAPINGB_P000939 [Saprochaete ingens]VVT45884.1 unnamed protein product [Saprochaete ingens]